MSDAETNQTFANGLHLDRVVWGGNEDQRGYLASSLRGHYAGLIHSVLEGYQLTAQGSARLVEVIRSPWFPAVIEATPAQAVRALETKLKSFNLHNKAYHNQYYAGVLVSADRLVNAMDFLATTARVLEDFREFTVYVCHGTDALDALIQGHGAH